MPSSFNLDQDGLQAHERLACRTIRSLNWVSQHARDSACKMILFSQELDRPGVRPRAFTYADLDTVTYGAQYKINAAMLVAYAERAHCRKLVFTNTFIYKTMQGPTWSMLDLASDIGIHAVLIDNNLANPPDVYRNTMTPQTVAKHCKTQRELIEALGELLHRAPSTGSSAKSSGTMPL